MCFCLSTKNLVSGSLYKAWSSTVATSIKETVTNFKVGELVPIFRLLLNRTRFTVQLSRASSRVCVRGCEGTGDRNTIHWTALLSFMEGCSSLGLKNTFPVRMVGALGSNRSFGAFLNSLRLSILVGGWWG